MSPETLAVNVARNFQVIVAPCLITKRFDRCLKVNLGNVEIIDSDGTSKVLCAEGTFSREGLKQLMADLESVPDPIGLPTQTDVQAATPYQWAVVMEDGDHLQQWPADGTETPFSLVHLPNVHQFWLLPKGDPNALSWYGLIKGVGFVKREGPNSGNVPLNLPHPGDEPFEWQYYRKVTHHFVSGGGSTHKVPVHVIQCLGWKLPQRGGEDLIFEIGIESDGEYQVHRRQPLGTETWD